MKEPGLVTRSVIENFSQPKMEGWPKNVILYQPHETDQCLIYQFAECLAVRALLHIHNLPFRVDFRGNAEFMSSSGDVPLLRIPSSSLQSDILVAGFDAISSLLKAQGFITSNESADEAADIAYVRESFNMVEEYLCWRHKTIRDTVTMSRYGSVYAWPLNRLVPALKWYRMRQRLQVTGAWKKTPSEVLKQLEEVCEVLSLRLGEKRFLYSNDKASEVDALVFGHLFNLITTELPDVDLKQIVRRYPNLTEFCQVLELELFRRPIP